MLRKVLGGILIYSVILYLVIMIGPEYDFHAIKILPVHSLNNTVIFLTLGGVFWLVYDVVRQVIKKITIPINWLTFGLLHILINVVMLYVFGAVVNNLELGVTIDMGTVVEVFILAILLWILGLFLKRL